LNALSPGADGAPVAEAGEPPPLWRHPAFRWPLLLAGALAAASPLWWAPFSAWLFGLELAVATWLPEDSIAGTAWFLLPAVGFGCGLLASFSPCVLPLVPLNVAAIGAADASGWRAVDLSARFVVGAALALAVLGMAGDLAGVLLIEQRGPVLLLVGAAMVYLGLAALELAPLPVAGRGPGAGRRLGPLGMGAAFSLVTTPCASPFAGAVLAAASAQAVPGLAAASMGGFALGYTALVFVGGVFGGGLVARLRRGSLEAPRAAAAAILLVAGAGFAAAGVLWF
jgi:cytochrome c-type biogenesis protein